jgi:diguanylate cyclase (GGDEF)-like protein
MGPRVARARTVASVATAVGTLAAVSTVGWWPVPLYAIVFATFATIDRRIRAARRPERVVVANLLLVMALMGTSAALTGGAVSPVLTWLVIPVSASAMRFRAQVVWAAAGCAVLLILGVALTGVHTAIHHPLIVIAALVLLIAVTAVTTALMDAELQFRGESVLDSLTGLLNRSGLAARFAEVAGQARMVARPVCLIICDLDHFKLVNDEYGHARGDAVLREVAYEMRKSLHSFELFYRLGGEEFLVLLPGVDLIGGVEIAQHLREAVQGSQAGGLPITASFGVSAATGEEIEFLPLYRAADEALYQAKAEGRDRVVAFHHSAAFGRSSPAVGSAPRSQPERASFAERAWPLGAQGVVDPLLAARARPVVDLLGRMVVTGGLPAEGTGAALPAPLEAGGDQCRGGSLTTSGRRGEQVVHHADP